MEEMSGLLAQHGLLLVFANVLLTQLGVPLPAIPILAVAGAFVAEGRIALAPLMLAKYIPGFSTVAPPLSGAMRVGLPAFLGYSIVAALLWVGLPIALGAVFHTEVERALEWIGSMGTGALAVVAAVVVFYIGVKTIERTMLIRFLRMVRVSVDELRELMRQETKPVVLDVRSAMARKLDPRRIPGAIWVDIAAPQAALVAMQPDQDVVVYCS